MFKHSRGAFQAAWVLVTNSYVKGFVNGTIYRGPFKSFCVPGLNCYSCPGAVASCPIGSLQAVGGSPEFKASLYVIGLIIIVGTIFGRFVCGWLCPFGWFQDLLYRIPFPKKIKTFKGDKPLRFMKYIILLVFVILIPLFVADAFGNSDPFFCKYICPSGTAMAGWPFVIFYSGFRDAIGWLFAWKSVILIVTILLSIVIYRPFCKYICPLGAIYALFNKFSFYKIQVDEEKCTSCNACTKKCKMGVEPYKTPNSSECIRCGDCVRGCPHKAICSNIDNGRRNYTKEII